MAKKATKPNRAEIRDFTVSGGMNAENQWVTTIDFDDVQFSTVDGIRFRSSRGGYATGQTREALMRVFADHVGECSSPTSVPQRRRRFSVQLFNAAVAASPVEYVRLNKDLDLVTETGLLVESPATGDMGVLTHTPEGWFNLRELVPTSGGLRAGREICKVGNSQWEGIFHAKFRQALLAEAEALGKNHEGGLLRAVTSLILGCVE